MIRPLQIAYLAGLFDGEGSVSASPSYHSPDNIRISITISMCDRAPVDCFAEVFGGRIRVEKNPTKAGKSIYTCSYYCRTAADALEEMLPYLIAKADRARDAIILARMMKPRGKKTNRELPTQEEVEQRHALRQRIRAANFGSNGRIARYAA